MATKQSKKIKISETTVQREVKKRKADDPDEIKKVLTVFTLASTYYYSVRDGLVIDELDPDTLKDIFVANKRLNQTRLMVAACRNTEYKRQMLALIDHWLAELRKIADDIAEHGVLHQSTPVQE